MKPIVFILGFSAILLMAGFAAAEEFSIESVFSWISSIFRSNPLVGNTIGVQDVNQTCSGQGGVPCPISGNTCTGTLTSSSDYIDCCIGTCSAITTTTTVVTTTTETTTTAISTTTTILGTTTTLQATTTTTILTTTTTISSKSCTTNDNCLMDEACTGGVCTFLNCQSQPLSDPNACNKMVMNHACIDNFCPSGSICATDQSGNKYCQNQATTTTMIPVTTTIIPTTTTLQPCNCDTGAGCQSGCQCDPECVNKCGDKICDEFEKTSNACPIDCQVSACTSDMDCLSQDTCVNNACKYMECWKESPVDQNACGRVAENHQCVDHYCDTNEQCFIETHSDGSTTYFCNIATTCSSDSTCPPYDYCDLSSGICKSLFCNTPTDPNACSSRVENHKCVDFYCPTGQECAKDNSGNSYCRPIGGGGEYGQCNDKIDNDNDQMADCQDPDCGTDTICMKVCGDKKCDFGEDPMNCAVDCGGSNILCSIDSDCANVICPTVVGGDKPKCSPKGQCYCGGVCGDQYCDYYEQNSGTCTSDCYKGGEHGMCSDGIDNENDGMTDCKDPDCGPDPACIKEFCGNNFCGFGEDPKTCPVDCGGAICGCNIGSGCQPGCNCDPDCFGNTSSNSCGDGTCQPWEDKNNCPKDCVLTDCNSVPIVDNNVLTNYKDTSECFDFSAGMKTTSNADCDLKFTGSGSKDQGFTDYYALTAGSGKIMGINAYVNLNNIWQVPPKDSSSYVQSFPLYQVEDGLALITMEGNYVAFVVHAVSPDSITFSYKYSASNILGCQSQTGCSQYSDENSCKSAMMMGMNCYWDFTLRACNEQTYQPIQTTTTMNPGCGIFNGPGADMCNKIEGCSWNVNNGQCIGTIPEVKCENIKDETLCNKIPMLSTCCTWSSGVCQATTDITCREKPMEPPEGAKFCDDYNAFKDETLCKQIAGDPWYMPCVWNSEYGKCEFNNVGMFTGGQGTFNDINSKSNCEAAGGVWKSTVYTYTDEYGTVKTGTDEWCEMKFGFDAGTCDTSCWACETKPDGSQWVSEEEARQACKNSKLGFCEFYPDVNAKNGIGFCNPKQEFIYGGANCDFNCYDCAKMQNKQEACDNSKAGCKWIVDPMADLGGYCDPINEKSCENDCFRCDTSESCSQKGPSCTWTDSKVCIPKGFTGEICFDGIDNDNNGQADCGDPKCAFDSFCGGGMISDCPKYSDQQNCESGGCFWNVEGGKAWCADPGEKCVQFDGDESGCISQTDCQWSAKSECDVDKDAVENCLGITDANSCNANSNCKWFADISGTGGWCDTKFFSCKDRQQGKDVCESDTLCRWIDEGTTGFSHCEPRCFTATQSECNNGCKWLSGICDPKNSMKGCPEYENAEECALHKECNWDPKSLECHNVMSFNMFKGIESPPVNLANDPCGGNSPDSGIPAEQDICYLGLKDEPDSYALGTAVGRIVDSAVCRGVQVKSDKDTLVVGTGIKPSKFYWYLDTDGNSINGCKSGNGKENGFEFFIRYETKWVTNATDTSIEGGWALNGITVDTGNVEIAGKGWLEAKGNGSIQFRGRGRIEINSLGSAGSSTLIITDYSNPMDGDWTTEGFTSKTSAGVTTYTGKGSAVIKGSDIAISLVGDNIYFYGEGIGKATLKGSGAYKKGKVSGNVDTTMVAYRCTEGSWAPVGIKLTSMREKMCSILKGGIIVINKDDIKKSGLYNSTANMRIYASTATESGSESTPADSIGPAYYTPGTIDFKFTDCFAPGNTDPNCQKFKKYGFVQMEDCKNGIDDDSDGFIDCSDKKCKFAPECNKDFTKIQKDANDKTAPKVIFHKVDTFPDGAFIAFHTDEPSNCSVEFYYVDKTCVNLNKTIVELGDPNLKFSNYKPFHGVHIDNSKGGNPYRLGYDLAENTTYYYKTINCDPSGNCAVSACSNFTTKTKAEATDFVVKFELPDMMTVNMDFGGDGSYDVENDAMNYGKKLNYSDGKSTNVEFNDMNLSAAIELIGMSFTGSEDINMTDAFIIMEKDNETYVGMDTGEWQEVKDFIPDQMELTIPDDGNALYKCNENGENCTDVTAGAEKLENESNETQSTWLVPVSLGFSVYKVAEATTCSVKGDKTPCDGEVSDFELLDYIGEWAMGTVDDFDMLSAIDKWAKG